MVRKLIEKIKVPNNSEMEACKRILSNTHIQNVVNVVAYLSFQVTKISPNTQIENKKKRRLSEVRTGQIQGIGHGSGRWKSERCDGVSGHVIGGYGGGGCGGDPDLPYNNRNGVHIQEIYRDFSSADWDVLQGNSQSYVRRQRSCERAGGGCSNDGAYGGRGSGKLQHISDTYTVWYDSVPGGCVRGGIGAHNGA